jgi:uncharacterized iron-regulated protein
LRDLARLVAAFWLCAACMSQAREVGRDDLLALPAADVVILGEVHDNPAHHLNQATALEALAPAAVAFEMLSPEQAAIVNAGAAGTALMADALGWAESGWPPFDLYAPVFEALGAARVYGMAVPRDAVMASFQTGAAAGFAGDAERFGLDTALPDEEQAAREALQMAAHCDALPPEMLPGMVAAQRLRDAAFADTVLKALAETGGPVAVITGSGHARTDWGMPAALRHAAPEVTVLSLGQIEDHGEGVAAPPFDLWLVTAPADRPDPCAAFADRVQDG